MNNNERHSMDYLLRARVLIEELNSQSKFDQVIRFFEENSSELKRKGEHDSALILSYAARAYARRMKLPEALRTARLAEAELTQIGETADLADVYLTLGRILRDMGELVEAERSFRDAESIYRRTDNDTGRGQALNRLAQICFMRSDMAQAISLLNEAIRIARLAKDSRKLAFLYGNLGRIQSFVGSSQKAIDNLKLNIELSLELGDEAEVAKAKLSLGYEFLRLERFSDAHDEFVQAEEIIQSEKMNAEEVDHLIYVAELETRRENYELARQATASAIRLSERLSPNGDLSARARRVSAELALAEGKWRRALNLARDAEELFAKLGEKIDLGVIFRIQAEALSKLGFDDEAMEKFARCLDMLDGSGAAVELATALEWAGRSDVFSLHKRLAYLFRAQEMHARRGDSKARERIDRFIARAPEFSVGYQTQTETALSVPRSSARVGPKFITASEKVEKILSQLSLIRNGELPVMLTGETGVGKGYLARYFHSVARPDGPFVAFNVTNVPETLLESELFGHVRGAYTDAVSSTHGLLAAANGGVLFLDEIGEMPLSLQTRLLNVIEEKRFRPLGSVEEVQVDFILVTATNRDLRAMVAEKTFRRDLYHRLDGFTFEIPPLRERKEDIPLLLEYCLNRYGLLEVGVQPESELIRQFVSHSWPGNVRELENMVKRMKALSSLVKAGSLVELVQSAFDSDRRNETDDLFNQVERFEKSLILEALISSRWNKSQAARELKVHESTLRAKMKRYQIKQSAA